MTFEITHATIAPRCPNETQDTADPVSAFGSTRAPGVPKHVAIIMDGNGRWAQARGLHRSRGHRKGVEAVRATVRAAGELGIETLTLFSFSSENWNRPAAEINELMRLLKIFIRRDLADLHKENVRISIIGSRDGVPSDILPLLDEAVALTRNNTRTRLVIAFNYGARDELARATQRIAEAVAAGTLDPSEVTQDTIAAHMDTAGWSDPELIIRTSGEKRLSNFLLWQAAYSEFVFVDCMWPEFDKAQLEAAIGEYVSRDRRFGGLADTTQLARVAT
ncbi:isoprenyl transferase [Ahrensia sp. R2A130]|uniref:isoprenyl transferase n=1 Tax=Ahrensia sp. R2A130 TaxID=744979 RepID=UPI0001E0C993|nr:isoprenyl transferase [Ahrensia sp. R2A130]EFL90236.1 undecaprenyl pyrophosphate synthetase 1 [Ahrensia sp. R2A130]